MTFAAPAYLGLLALIPLIVLLHMRRRRVSRVPSTGIWQLVAAQTETRPRLTAVRPSASLWLQIATVLLAALTLAEPRIASSAGVHHVLVLDAGLGAGSRATGEAATAYEASWHRWLDEVRAASGRDTFSVWWVGPWTRPLALELETMAAVRRSLEASSHADAPADWYSAFEALAGHRLADASVTVVAGNVIDAREALRGLGVRDLTVRALAAPAYNIELAGVGVELLDEIAQRWSIQATARLAGGEGALPEVVTFRVTFLPHGTSVPLPYVEQEVRLNIGGEARFSSELTLPGAGVLEVAVTDEDQVHADGAARFLLDPAPPRPRAQVVSPLGGSSPSARLLHATGRFEVVVGEGLEPGQAFDLVVVEGVPDPFGDREPGTPAVLRLGSPSATQADDASSRLAQAVRWDPSHPAAGATDWQGMSGARAVAVDPLGEVLVEGLEGPLVVARSTRASREIVAAYDPTDPRFVENDGFVTFMVDALDWLVPPATQVTACTVGSPCRVPWSVAASGFEAHLAGAPSWRQPPPAGVVVPSRLDEAWIPTRAGVWWVTTGDGETHPFPVNAVAGSLVLDEESNPEVAPRRIGPALTWRGLVSLLIVASGLVVLVEGLIAGRRPESFWRQGALRAPGAAGRRARRTAALHAIALASCVAAVAAAPFLVPSMSGWLVVIGEGEDRLPPALEGWDASRVNEVHIFDHLGAVDLKRALEEAAARVDPAHGLDVVFTSHPSASRADTLRGLGPLLERGAAVHVLDAPAQAGPVDAIAADLLFAGTHFDGDALEVTGLVHASVAMPAVVKILLDGHPIGQWSTELAPGWSSFSATSDLLGSGGRSLTLEIDAEGDEVPYNDDLEKRVEVRTGPRVTVFASDVGRAETFADALELEGFHVEVKEPHAVGSRPEAFAGNDAVVLMDVAAIDLARSQQDALDTWVREHGGGLALLGGERSFGPGGYLETPLDSMSPLSSKISRDAPAVAMLFVLDRSGSMQQVVDGVSRLDIAKEATLAANALLGEGSEIAIVVFDEEARVLLPFTDSSARNEIEAALAPLVPGGGTFIYPGLALAGDLLAGSDAASKHVVVMTDGLSQPGDVEPVVQRLVGLGATVSAIAVGSGADVERVRNIARVGGGTAHTTTDFRALPSILAQEAMLLAGDPVVRERVVPVGTGVGTDLMANVPSQLPELSGLVETTPKAAASVLIEDQEGRPVLSLWRYGAGRVLGYASQAVGPWSSEWSGSPEFSGWWATWLRWAVQPGRSIGVGVEAKVVADEVRVDVLATDDRGMPQEGLRLTAIARAVAADGTLIEGVKAVGPIPLAEVAPGQYRGHLPARDGFWEVNVDDVTGAVEIADTAIVVRSYSAVQGAPRPADPLIDGLVDITGGRRLSAASGWTPSRDVAWSFKPAWRPWFLIAVAVWMLFLVQRYAPNWLAPPRFRSRRVSAGSATTWRAQALRHR